jgi:hypothetical protein
MENLCDLFDGIIPVHDPEGEYEMLKVSDNMSLTDLAKSDFLKDTFNRYRRYLRYIDFSSRVDGELVCCLINEFISSRCVDIFLAAKCVAIDRLLLAMME